MVWVTACGDGAVRMAVDLIPAVINARVGIPAPGDVVPVSYKSGNMARFVCQRS